MLTPQLNLAIDSARAAAGRGDFAAAAETQERVVAHARAVAQSADDFVTLSALLFNLADYYTGMERWDDAIRLLEEVVALDERMTLPDADSDREALESARRLAAMTPAQRAQFYSRTPQARPTLTTGPDEVTQILSQLNVPPDERAELEWMMRQMRGMSAEEMVRRAMEMRGRGERG
ncbi:MAG: tetratricopeptide repeat protein [Chloroflexi bacterium]|nr:tetratricopeptide repeat protein [Chloroflexota bacterium]